MSEMLDVAPELPRYGEAEDALLLGRRPGLGEYLGGSVSEGFWGGTTTGAWSAMAGETRGAQEDDRPMSREEWEASGYARLLGPAWDERMTRGRAAAQARHYDDEAYRRALLAARDPSTFETILGFGGQLVGSIPDPVNFVPIGRGVELGLRAAGAVRAADVLARPGVAASALRGSADAVLGNALAAPAVYAVQERYGEEITFDKVLADLAIGAVIGAGFGTIGGLLSPRAQLDATTAVRTVDQAASDLAAGRPMDVPGSLAARAVDDAVMRAAPPEMAGVRVQDLPTAPGGAPLSRAEFDAMLAERGGPPITRLAQGAERFTAEGPDGFVRRGDGSPDLAMMPSGIEGVAPLPIRLARGEHDAETKKGRGIIHIEGQRAGQVIGDPAEFVLDVLDNLTEIRQGRDGSVVVASREAGARSGNGAMVSLRRSQEGFYEVITAGRFRASYFDRRKLLWEGERRSLPDTGPEASDPLQRGGQSASDIGRAAPASKENRTVGEAIRSDAYAWYREALDAQRHVERMAAPVPENTALQIPRTEQNQGLGTISKEETVALTLPGPEAAQLEALRTEGRLTAADEAILRAGDEQAAELQGVAKGLKEAGECLLRNMA